MDTLTKAKTEEEALKEMQDNKLSQKPITGFQFNVKDARVISGDGIGTIMEQIIVSGFKPNKDNSATFVECRCGHRMPKLYATENGQIVDISKEFEGKPVSYQGPVQVAYSLSKGKNDGRIYLNVDGVMFATKPDVFVPDENGGNGRDVSAAFAPTAFYGQTAAPAQPAGICSSGSSSSTAGTCSAGSSSTGSSNRICSGSGSSTGSSSTAASRLDMATVKKRKQSESPTWWLFLFAFLCFSLAHI